MKNLLKVCARARLFYLSANFVGIYPLANVYTYKAKILKRPTLDVQKLLELHGGEETSTGGSSKVERSGEVPVLDSV